VLFAGLRATAEMLFRLALPEPWLYPRDPPEDALMQLHESRGYALRPNLTRRWARPDFDVEVRTSSEGLRDSELAGARQAALRVLAVGDSYTFGIGVEAEDTWPEQLERRLGGPAAAAVVNTGVPGYSARQMRQAAEEFWPAVRPQVIVAGLYASSFWRVENPYTLHGGTLITTKETAAVEVLPEGTLLTTAFAPGSALRGVDLVLKQHLHLGAHLLSLASGGRHWPARSGGPSNGAALRNGYAPALAELSALHELARGHGTLLVVLAINAQQADGGFAPVESEYNAILREHCARENIPFVDPLPEMVAKAAGRPLFRHPDDAHWTPAAHEIAARMLDVTLRRAPAPPAP
jgi:lysophospholipase L1-like esterase